MKPGFLLYGVAVVIIASLISWGQMVNRAGGSAWRSSGSGPGTGSWSSGGHK